MDKEIVGKDSDAELIGGEVLGFAVAGWAADWVDWDSALDFGEKKWERRWLLTEDALAVPPFPEGEEGELEEVSMEELLLNRRGIAEGSSDLGVVARGQ